MCCLRLPYINEMSIKAFALTQYQTCRYFCLIRSSVKLWQMGHRPGIKFLLLLLPHHWPNKVSSPLVLLLEANLSEHGKILLICYLLGYHTVSSLFFVNCLFFLRAAGVSLFVSFLQGCFATPGPWGP